MPVKRGTSRYRELASKRCRRMMLTEDDGDSLFDACEWENNVEVAVVLDK